MPKAIVQTIVSETISAADAANTGWQRDASHSRIGNRMATEATGSHGSGGTEAMTSVITANAASATTPSIISLRCGGARRVSARPIISGATVMMPMEPDANQCCQVVQIGAVRPWSNL